VRRVARTGGGETRKAFKNQKSVAKKKKMKIGEKCDGVTITRDVISGDSYRLNRKEI